MLKNRENTLRVLACALGVLVMVHGLGAQQPAPAAAGRLTIAGDITQPLSLTPADLKSMPRRRVEHKEKDQLRLYEGVLVSEVLKRAGVALGEQLRGRDLATYVVASATDGYEVVFSLAELDPAFIANDVIVADTVDGAPIPQDPGPFRIVAPKESRGARSVRMLQRLDIVRLRK
jgi:DMSO/TMAO reductase YedYZ molybdopterin-dependent catalytic subunit